MRHWLSKISLVRPDWTSTCLNLGWRIPSASPWGDSRIRHVPKTSATRDTIHMGTLTNANLIATSESTTPTRIQTCTRVVKREIMKIQYGSSQYIMPQYARRHWSTDVVSWDTSKQDRARHESRSSIFPGLLRESWGKRSRICVQAGENTEERAVDARRQKRMWTT